MKCFTDKIPQPNTKVPGTEEISVAQFSQLEVRLSGDYLQIQVQSTTRNSLYFDLFLFLALCLFVTIHNTISVVLL